MERIKLLLKKLKDTPPHKIIGYILITPSLVCIFVCFTQLGGEFFFNDQLRYPKFNSMWTGVVDFSDNSATGYTSPLPIAFAIMAIAGVYLIKEK